MSLIGFHRVLIGSAIAFCFGFAAWELVHYWVVGGGTTLVLCLVFVTFGVALSVYLRRLAYYVGYAEGREEEGAG
jgi:hypothetical protein